MEVSYERIKSLAYIFFFVLSCELPGGNSDLVDLDSKWNRRTLLHFFTIGMARDLAGAHDGADALTNVLNVADTKKYAVGYSLQNILEAKRKQKAKKGDRYHTSKYGQALRYGQYAVIAVAINKGLGSNKKEEDIVDSVLNQWKLFEEAVQGKKSNGAYAANGSFDFNNYYKGSTINSDVKNFGFNI